MEKEDQEKKEERKENEQCEALGNCCTYIHLHDNKKRRDAYDKNYKTPTRQAEQGRSDPHTTKTQK